MLRALGTVLVIAGIGCGSTEMSGETGSTSGTGSTGTTTSTSGTASTTSTGEAPTSSSSTTGEPGGNLLLSDKFLNIAHRGGASLRPEETLLAFEHALAVGADVLEFDVHASSDGVIVAMHDGTVDRTTDGTGPIKAQTLAQLRALDAGYRAFDTAQVYGNEAEVGAALAEGGVAREELCIVTKVHPENYGEADFLQRIGRCIHELLYARRHVADTLVPGGRDDVPLA